LLPSPLSEFEYEVMILSSLSEEELVITPSFYEPIEN